MCGWVTTKVKHWKAAALEKKLADTQKAAGYDVLNKMHSVP
jgi:hypothetical protein